MRKKTVFLGMLATSMMCIPAPAAFAAQGNSMDMSILQQNQGIKGSVLDATGEALVGASVKVVGTTTGAVTDIDGNFTINCKPGTMIEVSYIGYKTLTVKAATGMKITLQEDGKALNEVVVTALGIKRDRKALGYGLEEVKGEELTKAKETNVINSLSGKVAGLVVQNTAGGASGSTRVLLRGNTEMAGNNQPLYVVDGVPLDNTNFGSAGEAGGYDLGDGISAINPDDIETMTVLKGPAASALYGSRASHGVILITTKKAEKDRVSVEYNGSYTVDTQLAKWDDIQETYGMGYNGALPTSSTAGTNSSWGPKADNFIFKYFDGEERPFKMYPNNASGFFRTGFTTQNSAILSVNSGKTGMRFSVTDMRNKDILPNTHMNRDNFNLRVNIDKHLKLQGTIGTDLNNMTFDDFIARTTPGTPAGKLTNQIFNNRTLNAELLALYNNSWGDFDVNATAGGNIFRVNNKTVTNVGLNQQMDGIINIMNYQEQNTRESMYKKQISSLYASASIGYKHTYYLEGTVRGDKSSTLPTSNNTYVYPSVSGSMVFSEFIKNKKIINYGKIRASWAKVGSDTDPYQLALNYTTGKYSYSGYTIGMIANATQPNKDLKPTMTNSYELGLEMKFFNGRLSLDATYYNQNSKNQILSLASTTTSGYAYRLINAGEIQNKGIEIALNGRALQINDFAWDLGVNFSKNSNKVKSLTDGMNYFEMAKATWCGVSVGAQVGEDYGAIRGHDFLYNDNGQVIIDATTGLPKVDQKVKTIGNSSWDWTGGFYTTLSYKNFRLSASFDVKVGADIYSMSMRSAYHTGKAKGTVTGRDAWYASEEARQAAGMDIAAWREAGLCKGFVANGVIDNGDGTYRKNDIAVNPEDYWKHIATNVQSQFVYDNSYVKCREITFGYTFPENMLGKYVKGLAVSFVARNPFIIWKNIPNIDPDSSYNTSGLGLEYGSLPSRKSYGLNVNVKF